jgi:DNA polymerase-3 subunit alpha
LDAIKFVGEDAIKDIISKRPFKDFFDFMTRISSKSVRANSIQALAACGALDSF